eukprot:CAMPEP_0170195418 /NCGR_PEP_ID=MMETSP0040_2-20121228/61496_1 /TAXON_ID=641309 /ORGANISM="Lotharella oceanica, Strain CCMP622" /LENGTH=94 /DNA_ID=CAMNT_0010444579 /DNA_START=386 /DNA_END=670 /DNA_ORIENTATION=-
MPSERLFDAVSSVGEMSKRLEFVSPVDEGLDEVFFGWATELNITSQLIRFALEFRNFAHVALDGSLHLAEPVAQEEALGGKRQVLLGFLKIFII